MEQDAVARRTLLRNILMWGFHFLVAFVGGVRGVKDTQCGFKLFSRRSARMLFSNLHIERWCFDIELLYCTPSISISIAHSPLPRSYLCITVCSRFGIPVQEVAVNWQEIPGSKLGVVSASLQMAKDLVRIRVCYMFGVWRASTSPRLKSE
jgi:dolichyl-phosphate beta-glucosyltransferase